MTSTKSVTRWCVIAVALLLFTGAGGYAGHATWMQAKARLAQYLIADAWRDTLATGRNHRPWSWADTWPVAKLVTPSGHPLYVLAGMSGATLAFGPGMPATGSLPGEKGTTLIAGHKNTHFHFLKYLKRGEVVRLQNRQGDWFRYRITSMYVANSNTETLPMQYRRDALVLTTCFPFGPGHYDSALRYVVKGVRL